ncbi:uncharacterized protein LOC122245241 [Penaeus japonicus]|uniref:uncharacterized protein LOC122245241 n=1 Tax=Penaeus japonicus TaxID=27405 RepID=UPI001C7130B2|nr:uncharacterized protein LOC122245241 [Penaeus japonicus]
MKFAPALLLLLMVAAMQLDISVLGDRTPPTHATPSPPGQHPHRHAHSWPKSRDTHKDAHELRGGRNELSHHKKSRAFSDWQVENQLLFDQFNDNTTERQTDSWKTSPHLMNADSQDLKMGADTSSNQSLWTIPQVGACHSTKGTGRVCRVGRRCLPAAIYALEACALCYSYIPTRNFKQKLRFRVQPFHSAHGLFNLTVLHNGTHAVRRASLRPSLLPVGQDEKDPYILMLLMPLVSSKPYALYDLIPLMPLPSRLLCPLTPPAFKSMLLLMAS